MPDPAFAFDPPRREGEGEILVVGDSNLMGGNDSAASLRHVMPTLSAADAVLGQMEGLILPDAETGPDPLPYKPGWRHSAPKAAAGYADLFSAVSAASNVAYPPAACADTADRLAEVGLPVAGIGKDIAAARAPAIVESPVGRIGLLSYTSVFHPALLPAGPDTPGCAVLPAITSYRPGRRALEMPGAPPEICTWPDPTALRTLREDIGALRRRVDLLLVSCHWGVSGSVEPEAYQTSIAEAAAEAGADLIFGHHPHVIQGASRISTVPVFYSLGNFAFENPRMIGRHREGLMLRLLIRDRRIACVTVVPVQRDEANAPRILSPDEGEGASILETFRERSGSLGGSVRLGATGAVLD